VPTYQYACTDSACGHRFDAVQSFSDDPLTSCPVCEGRLRKVFSAVGVVFKGSGFYRNDSREKPKASVTKDSKDSNDSGKGEQKAAPSSSSDSSGSGSSTGSSGSSTSSGSSASGSTGSGSSGSSGSSSKPAAS
jgi:putative FmdB family regulatory protein